LCARLPRDAGHELSGSLPSGNVKIKSARHA
jgi:hypothetical protein